MKRQPPKVLPRAREGLAQRPRFLTETAWAATNIWLCERSTGKPRGRTSPAAAGIAWINSIGNLGGFFGPWYVGWMRDLTGSYTGGLYRLALVGLLAAGITAFFLDIRNNAVAQTQLAE